VYGDYEDMFEVPEILDDTLMDLLEYEDTWIVVLGLDRDPFRFSQPVHSS
jgi:hypothetical protein